MSEFLLETYYPIELLMCVHKNIVYIFKYYFFPVPSLAQIILKSEGILFLVNVVYPMGNKE